MISVTDIHIPSEDGFTVTFNRRTGNYSLVATEAHAKVLIVFSSADAERLSDYLKDPES